MHRKCREDPTRGEPVGAPKPRASPARDRREHRLGGNREPGVNSERSPTGERDQHAAIPVRDDGRADVKPGGAQPGFE